MTEPPVAAAALDRLAAEWERMSEGYLPGRSALIDVAVRAVAETVRGERPLVVDLGSGPGTVLDRVVAALPHARVIGVEPDPVLAAVHRLRSARLGRVPRLLTLDLAVPSWSGAVAARGQVDVVLAVQVLHYFDEDRARELLGEIRGVLAPRGVLVHLDTVPEEAAADRVEAAAGDDAWASWWHRAAADPALADAFARRVHPPSSAEFHPDQVVFDAMLTDADLIRPVMRRRRDRSLLTVVGAGRGPVPSAGPPSPSAPA
ncbi:MAG: class I SAM-dependent methyltransferase [Actinomycetales bacterium]